MAEKSFNQSLIAVQSKLKAPKSAYNSFGKYNYRSTEDILEAVKPLLAEYALLLTIDYDLELVGEWHYAKATATITDGTSSLSVRGFAREDKEKKGMDGSQITGTAFSYAAKRALGNLFLIDDTKDSDATNDHGKAQQQSAPVPDQPVYRAPEPRYEVSDEMYTEIRQLFKNAAEGIDGNALYAQLQQELGHGISRDMTKAQWQDAYKWLGRRVAVG